MKSIYPNLVNKMIEYGISYGDLASLIGTSVDIVSLKMMGAIPWTLVDAVRICCHLCTSDINFLFLQLDTNT